ncbi:hypothetical protein [Pelosinus sp. IPA-1]|uniref:hypothetical protein n=1 Tax=Pelosinus sp. IPA-1 TaxID=3029569 RepID=UPI00243628BC|nr:hypothetical protein [Pelosinus sp. IPA-1]GMA99682.1 hypothetical protein PIPA1_24820 [Pelosinus sp. IPA-1]
MTYERKKCQGLFRGFVMERKDKKNGLYQAIAKGECTFIEYVEHADTPALLLFEKEIVNTLIETDKMPLFDPNLINNKL